MNKPNIHNLRQAKAVTGASAHGQARLRQHRLAFCISTAIGMMAGSAAYANPGGAQVVNGTVQFANPAPGQLNVTNTPGAIINWNQFSVGANETTRFIQQSAASAVLNRVTGPDISQILGNLQSNGRVFLINNNGVVFGQNAVVDTAGFVASTLNMSNDDFRAGKYRFTGGENSGDISNQGVIRAGEGGNVILIAPHIENGGVVEVTDGGNIVLAAGKSLTLTSWENPTVQFEVQAPEDSVLNLGKVLADGGAARIFAGSVRHSGEIRADGVRVGADGAIEIFASHDVELSAGSVTQARGVGAIGAAGNIHVESASGTTTVAGTVTANSDVGKGGRVELLGDYVQLASTGKVTANGASGGGTVLVGGDYQGKGTVKNASTLSFARGAVVSADALSRGDGGKVILWSDDNTQAFGHTSARGGAQSGDGGFIEVSGKALLRYDASSDTSAANGTLGTTLLDPLDTCVTSQANCADTGTNNVFNDLVDPGTVGTTVSLVSVSSVNNATSNVSIQAQNLDFEEAVNIAQEGADLDARATGSIRVGASITTNGGAISLTANDGTIGTPLGGTSIQVLGAITSVNTSNPGAGDGAISLSNINAANNIDIFAPINAGSANVQIDGSGLVQQLSGGIITANQLGLNIGSNQQVSFELGGNDVNSLNVTVQDAGTGGFFKFINTTGDLTVSNLAYAGADPSYFAIVTQGNDLLFGSSATGAVNMAAGNFTAITTTGSILDGDADAATINPNIVLGNGELSLRSQSRIGDQSGTGNGPLDTKVSKLAQLQSINTGSDIRIRNVGALDLNGTGGFSSAGKTVLVSATDGGASSAITISSAVQANAGSLKLKADDLIINNNLDVTGQTVRFVPFTTGKGYSLGSARIGSDVYVDQAELLRFVGASNAKIGPGSNDSQTVGDINITAGGINLGGANVTVDITGSVVFAQGAGLTGLATTGDVTATSSAGAVIGSLLGTDIMANSLAITAVTGIGSTGALNTAVNSLSVVNTGSADINIANETGGSALTITQAINSAQADRAINLLNQQGDLVLNGNLAVSGTNGFVTLTTGSPTTDGGSILQQSGTVTAAKLGAVTQSDLGAAVDFTDPANAIGQFSARSRSRSNTAAASGVLHLENSGDVVIAGLETTGRADINVGGSLSQGTMAQDAILVGELNATTNNAAPKNITFDNAANDVNVINLATLNGAAMPAPGGGSISFTDVNALAIGPSTAMGAPGGVFTDKDSGGTITLTVGGNLSQDTTSALSADNLTLNIQPNASVSLGNSANSVKSLAVNVGTTGSGGSFLFQNAEANTTVKVVYAGTDNNYTATINQTGVAAGSVGNLLFGSGANGVDMLNGNFVATASGDILDNDSDATLREYNIKLGNGNLSLAAGGEIGRDKTLTGSNGALDTQVGTLVKATSGSGKDIRIRNIGALNLQSAASADLTSGGKFVLVSATDGGATSSIAVNSVINAAGTVKAKTDNLAVNAQINMAGQVGRVLPFTSGRGISIGDTESGTTGSTLHLTQTELNFFGTGGIAHAKFEPGSTDTQTIGDITFTSGVNFGNSAVTLGNTGNVVFAQGSAATGLTTSGGVTINTSGGAIQRNTSNVAAVDIVASTVSLKASTGIGGSAANAALLTQVGSLSGAEITTSGDVVIHNSGALTASGTLASKGLFELVTASPLVIDSALSAVGDISLQAGAPDTLTINAAVSSSAGDVNLTADQLEIGTGGSVSASATGKAINIAALTANRFIDIGDGSSSAGNPLAALRIDGTEVGKLTAGDIRFGNTSAGNITFTGNADFGSANLSAQTGGEIVFNHSASGFGLKTTGGVSLDASTSTTLGRIIGDPNSSNLDIQANALQMSARNGIGPTATAGDTNALQTQISSLAATTTNGDLRVDNNRALTINGASAGGQVAITNVSRLTVASSVGGGGNVLLRASPLGALITVNSGQSVSSATGDVTLEGSDLVLDGTVSATSGSVFVRSVLNTKITVGGSGGFGVSAAELSRISAGTGVEVGSSTHTGGLSVAGVIGGASSPFTAPKLTLASSYINISGQIALGSTTTLELLTSTAGTDIAADVSAGTINAVGQTVNITGASTLFGGALNASSLKIASGTGDVNLNIAPGVQTVRVESGRVIFPSAVSLLTGQVVELVGGSIKTAGDVTVTSGARIDWGDGTLDNTGTGNFIFNPGSTLNLTQDIGLKILDGRTITMQGNATTASTLNWIRGSMDFSNGASVINETGSIANITGNNEILQGVGAAGSWTNQGTVNKTSIGTTRLEIAFNNLGTLNVQGGIFELGSAPTVASSTFVIDPGATLRYSGGTHSFGTTGGTSAGTASFSGGGTVELLGANWVLNENVAMNTPMLWTGGTISGPAITAGSSQQPLQFALGAALTVDTGAAQLPGSTSLVSKPTASNLQFTTATGSGLVLKGSDALFLNDSSLDIASGIVLDIQTDASVRAQTGSTATINNAGTVRKSGGATNATNGGSQIEVAFNNNGRVEGQQGELVFSGSGTDTGVYDVSSGAFVLLGQEVNPGSTTTPPAITRTLNAGVQFTGAGTHVFEGNGINLNTDVSVATGSNFAFAGPNIGGSSTFTNNGTLSIFGNTTFTSGTIANAGTLQLGNYALLNNDPTDPLLADASLQAGSLSNTGTINLTNTDSAAHNLDLRTTGTLSNSGTISATAGTGGGARGIQGTLVNESAGVIDANSTDLAISGNTTGSITNRGSLKASGGNLALRDFSSFTQVDGAAVTVSAGKTFALIGNTPIAGNPPQSLFDWQGGDILGGGTWTNSNVNVSLAGTGTRVFNAITTAGDVNNPGNVAISGGSLEIAGGQITLINPLQVDAAASLIVSGGRAILNDDSTIANLRLDGGIVEGASGKTIGITNALVWNGGQIGPATGSGATLNANAGVTLAGTSTKTLNGTTLNLAAGTSTYSGGELTLGNAAELNIASGAIFDIQDSANIGGIGGGTITNAGTFRKSGGSGLAGGLPTVSNTSVIAPDFNNQGTVDLQQGALVFVGGGTDSGTYNAASGSLLGLTPAISGLSPAIRTLQDGVSFTGAGVHELEGGQLALTGIDTGVTVASGSTLLLFDAVLSGAGKLTNNGTLSVLGSSQFADGSVLNTGATQVGLFTALTVPSESIPAQTSLSLNALTNQGTLTFGGTGGNSLIASSGVSNGTGGVINGNGSITGDLDNNAGTVSPGNSPGTLAVTGDFTQGADGTLILEVNGNNTGEFDQLLISGTATLGGTLRIPDSTFVSDGSTLPLLTASNGVSGVFASEDVPATLSLSTGANRVEAQEAVTTEAANAATDDILATQQQNDNAKQQNNQLADLPADDAGNDATAGDSGTGDGGTTGEGSGDGRTPEGAGDDTAGDASGDDAAPTAGARRGDGTRNGDDSGSDAGSDDGTGDSGDQVTADDFETDDAVEGGDDTGTGSSPGDDSSEEKQDAGSEQKGDKKGDGADEKSDGKSDDKSGDDAKDEGKDAKSEDKDAKEGDKDKEDKDADKKKKKKKKKAEKKADKKKKVKKKKRKVEACK